MNAPFSSSSGGRAHFLSTLEREMRTFAATAALTIMFLSAGAFAGSNHRPASSSANVTVIEKNQSWPAGSLLIETRT
jgi:hypothetical protein